MSTTSVRRIARLLGPIAVRCSSGAESQAYKLPTSGEMRMKRRQMTLGLRPCTAGGNLNHFNKIAIIARYIKRSSACGTNVSCATQFAETKNHSDSHICFLLVVSVDKIAYIGKR